MQLAIRVIEFFFFPYNSFQAILALTDLRTELNVYQIPDKRVVSYMLLNTYYIFRKMILYSLRELWMKKTLLPFPA